MLTKRGVTILVIVAIILAGIAIITQFSNNEEISTTKAASEGLEDRGSNIGVQISSTQIEDKLNNREQP